VRREDMTVKGLEDRKESKWHNHDEGFDWIGRNEDR
jgi:hypothetical protein